MANQRQSKCLCCGDKFTVDARNPRASKALPQAQLSSDREGGPAAPLARQA